MPIPGSSGLALLAFYPGSPVGVSTTTLNIPTGSLVIDYTNNALYQKTSTTDNSTFNLVAVANGGTLTNPVVSGFITETSIQTLTGAGAVDVTSAVTKVVTTAANALTLANGTNGQIKTIVMITDGGDGTLTPTTKTGFSTITFNDVGDGVQLQYFTTQGWICIANQGATLA